MCFAIFMTDNVPVNHSQVKAELRVGGRSAQEGWPPAQLNVHDFAWGNNGLPIPAHSTVGEESHLPRDTAPSVCTEWRLKMLSKALLDSNSHWLEVGSWSRMQGSEHGVCLGLIHPATRCDRLFA